jgi:TolA-binding protein
VDERKASVGKILGYQSTIRRQDSLQRIAAMPEEDRNNYLTRLVRRLRIEQGLSETPATTSGSGIVGNPNAPTDLFPSNPTKGEWYFYNSNLKSQGLMQFKQTWGNRPNVDNWRRFADLSQQLVIKTPENTRPGGKEVTSLMGQDNTPTIASLQNGLPLTPAQLQASNDSIQNAMYNLGVAYMNDVENYSAAIEALENFRKRFPNYMGMGEVLFHLYYAYTKAGDLAKAEEIKQLILQKYPDSRYSAIIKTGKDPAASARAGEATKAYEEIYDLFISGKFDEAESAKRHADSVYHTSHWQPQLLYIEAVYQIKQRQDSIAKNTLQTIIGQDPNSPLATKAQNMIEVLGRRKQIEDELTRLQIERPKEDTVVQKPVVYVAPPPVKKDSLQGQTKTQVVVTPPKQIDSAIKKPYEQPKVYSVYKYDSAAKQYAMIILDKVDPVFVSEAKNAFDRYNKEVYYNNVFDMDIKELDADRKLILIGGFANQQAVVDYVQKARRIAPSEIVPWLKGDKYSFSIMTDANLNLLLSKKDLKEYKLFLDQNLPGKF